VKKGKIKIALIHFFYIFKLSLLKLRAKSSRVIFPIKQGIFQYEQRRSMRKNGLVLLVWGKIVIANK
jgi:hypothetical protein